MQFTYSWNFGIWSDIYLLVSLVKTQYSKGIAALIGGRRKKKDHVHNVYKVYKVQRNLNQYININM